MKSKETVAEFFDFHGQQQPMGQFNVYSIEEFGCRNVFLPATRRDFYKISLMTKGEGTIAYADKQITAPAPALSFLNPMVPYSWESRPEVPQAGYFCLFTEDFIDAHLRSGGLSQSPLFKIGGNHIFFPDEQQTAFLANIFGNMLCEVSGGYAHKYDLLKSYVQIVMHEAMKMQPADNYVQTGNASKRISDLFIELLERQFPINPPNQVIKLKNANEFAEQLSIHTNHLNRALKETTGKTTSEWIAGEMVREAKALLRHSSADVAEIGYCLGFEHPSNFNIFFKKQTGQTPKQFRNSVLSIS